MNRMNAVQFFSILAIIVCVAVSYFPPPSNGAAIWTLASGFLGYGVRDLFAPGGPPDADGPPLVAAQQKEGGFARVALLVLMAAGTALALSACGALNAYTGAALNAGEAGYTGAKQNAKSADDMKMIIWADTACMLPLGALQRNATGNPYAVNAALVACPIPNVGIVQAKDGQVQVQITPPTPSAPYAPATPTSATNAAAGK